MLSSRFCDRFPDKICATASCSVHFPPDKKTQKDRDNKEKMDIWNKIWDKEKIRNKNKINKIRNLGQNWQRKRKKGDKGNKDTGTIGTHGTIKKWQKEFFFIRITLSISFIAINHEFWLLISFFSLTSMCNLILVGLGQTVVVTASL